MTHAMPAPAAAGCVAATMASAPPADYRPAAAIKTAADVLGESGALDCLDWDNLRFPKIAVVSGLIDASDANTLLERMATVSQFSGMRYWSVTDRQLEVLIKSSVAVLPNRPTEARADFSRAEMQPGRELAFSERDNRLADAAIYRMRVLARNDHRFVIDITNVTAVKRLLFTVFSPGDLRTVILVAEGRPGVWTCLAVSGAHPSALAGLVENPKSHLNRLLALYGYLSQSDASLLPWER